MNDYFLLNKKKYQIEYPDKHLQQICESFGVRRLMSFGSINTDKFGTDSDIDILVKFDKVDKYDSFDQYFGLREKLENLFKRPVELVFEKEFNNPYFKESVNKTKRVLYEA